jgi:hypothetical protein
LVLSISSSLNIKYLTFLIDNMLSSEFEHLEPSSVGSPDLKVGTSATILDVKRSVLVLLGLDCLGCIVKVELLRDLSVSLPSED